MQGAANQRFASAGFPKPWATSLHWVSFIRMRNGKSRRAGLMVSVLAVISVGALSTGCASRTDTPPDNPGSVPAAVPTEKQSRPCGYDQAAICGTHHNNRSQDHSNNSSNSGRGFGGGSSSNGGGGSGGANRSGGGSGGSSGQSSGGRGTGGGGGGGSNGGSGGGGGNR